MRNVTSGNQTRTLRLECSVVAQFAPEARLPPFLVGERFSPTFPVAATTNATSS
jgi:hypothetical protein